MKHPNGKARVVAIDRYRARRARPPAGSSSRPLRASAAASRAALLGHPVHPMIIPFPTAFLFAAFVTDAVFWAGSDSFWARVSQWLIGAGLISGCLAALVGLIDFLGVPRVRRHWSGWVHSVGNTLLLSLAGLNLWLRVGDPVGGAAPWGLGLSTAVALLLAVTVWCGGELSYRHGIGVASRPTVVPLKRSV